ncbi:hypothetical protein ES754_00835 [Psychrobacter frigidicola]|uniref:6-bladed beta-propeller n=1 Tax=Psychrobacter frigidicola TaxID=45611 RepID=A0A5C7A4G6_9GAMM|nr:hypothetical protein [Psychrobacter frigidicola]TXD97565.1 hypothetical protein ES754_00835 [Psychrobacter frigidicola]
MRNAFLILTSLIVVGCTTAPVATPSESVAMIKPVPEVVEPEKTTSIFTYDVSPTTYAQPVAAVRGVFVWENGCIYIIDDGEYRTALFPSLPKGIFKWDEATKTLDLEGHVFKMGDYISTNGSYKRYTPNTVGGADYEKQGDKKCLTPSVAKIGTFFD